MDWENEAQPNEQSGAHSNAEQSMPRSPIRPHHPQSSGYVGETPKPSKPQPPSAADPDTRTPQTPEKVELALDNLRQKMAGVAQEYAEGKINQAQFNAIYRRYSEQRDITERLLERNPDSNAWQSVVAPGHTGFLRQHFAARYLSYAIYRLDDATLITLQGRVRLPMAQIRPVIIQIRQIHSQGHQLGAAWRQLRDESWVFVVPGYYTVAVVIFSLEPATLQRKVVEDAHKDFEQANRRLLERGAYTPDALVYPHRAILAEDD
ncbi:MAG: hypothetical protein ACLFTK_15000 [Anaerolineales bacterium]